MTPNLKNACVRRSGGELYGKVRIFSPGQMVAAIDYVASKGRVTSAYRCPECGYVHIGGVRGQNSPDKIAARLAARA